MKRWTTDDFISAEDWNRIRRGLYRMCRSFTELQNDVTVSSVPTQTDVDNVRAAFSSAIITVGAAAGWPNNQTLICEADDLKRFPANETYPNLHRFFDLVGKPLYNHFPAAPELNLYESILNYGKNRFGSPFAVFGNYTITGGGPFG